MGVTGLLGAAYAVLAGGTALIRKTVCKLCRPDNGCETPAVCLQDGRDFVPARPAVLFGHHFMSIAGTSPIIASIVGLVWGWVPAVLWMVLGVLLIGGVHDYSALMISVRHQGRSMGDVAGRVLGKVTGKMTSVVLAFGGILVYAIFLSILAGTLSESPAAAFPTLALIPIAVLCGWLNHRGLSLALSTAIGVGLTVLSIWLGVVHWPIHLGTFEWEMIFVGYTLLAIYTPVWILLQPRDYLNAAVLFAGLLLGLLGLVVGMPEMKMPAFVGFNSVKGPLWPVLFVTISCGAASGWHSLIAAGTTSKQLAREGHGFGIAYCGMVGETVMALLSAMLVCSAFDYDSFSQMIAGGSKAIGLAFSGALGNAMSHLGIPEEVGATIGALALAALTLTTLDSFARTGRYVVQEIAGRTFLKKPLPASLFVTVAGYALYKGVPFFELWHGLVLGGLLLLMIPFAILWVERRNRGERGGTASILHIGLPLAFLFPTTTAGLIYLFYKYWFTPAFSVLSGLLVVFLMVLLGLLTFSTARALRREKIT
jgi:carbon starvation protein